MYWAVSMSHAQAKNVVTGVDVKKSSDSFKSTQFFKKLQVCFAMID